MTLSVSTWAVTRFFFIFFMLLSRIWRLKLSTVSNVLFYFTRAEKVQSQLNSQMQCVELWENFIHSEEVIKTDEMQRYICCLRRILLKQFPLFLNCFCPSISTSLHSGKKENKNSWGRISDASNRFSRAFSIQNIQAFVECVPHLCKEKQ